MSAIKRIVSDIMAGRNIDIYLTVTLAVLVAVLGAFQVVDVTVVLSAVLATLALVSVSLLSNRQNNESIQRAIAHIEVSTGLANRFFTKQYDRDFLKQSLRNEARQLLFWATNATSTIPLIKDDVEMGLLRGMDAKFLFLKPESEAVQMHAFRNKRQNSDESNAILKSNIHLLNTIGKTVPHGSLEVKTVNYLPPYTIVAIDPELPQGLMFVRLLPFRTANDNRPVFKLTRKDDPEWFEYFVKQFLSVWEAAESTDV